MKTPRGILAINIVEKQIMFRPMIKIPPYYYKKSWKGDFLLWQKNWKTFIRRKKKTLALNAAASEEYDASAFSGVNGSVIEI